MVIVMQMRMMMMIIIIMIMMIKAFEDDYNEINHENY